MPADLRTEVEKIVTPILVQEAFDLVEIKLSRYREKYRLQIFIDSDNGVKLDDCAYLSGLIGTGLDLADVIAGRYVLEISSPGLDRPLHHETDFRRRIGRQLQVDFTEEGRGRSVQGVLTAVEDKTLILAAKKGRVTIALEQVRQGREII